jgi:hypothetical protein
MNSGRIVSGREILTPFLAQGGEMSALRQNRTLPQHFRFTP